MRHNWLLTRYVYVFSLLFISMVYACNSVNIQPSDPTLMQYAEPENFDVRKLARDKSATPGLHWTFVYTKSMKKTKMESSPQGNGRLYEFNVLCAFQDGKRLFYKAFHNECEPHVWKKGITTILENFKETPPAHVYWYNVIYFRKDRVLPLKTKSFLRVHHLKSTMMIKRSR